jgi:hypothetical protein
MQFPWSRETLYWTEVVKIKFYIGAYHSHNCEHVSSSTPAEIHKRFGEIFWLHLRGRKANNEGGGIFS